MTNAENKTQPTAISVTYYLATLQPDQKRQDATEINTMMRRVTGELPTPSGDVIRAPDGVWVQFAVTTSDGIVEEEQYRAGSCATLVAYCEVLGEIVAGRPLREAMRCSPEELVARLPGVPLFRQDHAALAVHALWSAVARTIEAQTPSQPVQTARTE